MENYKFKQVFLLGDTHGDWRFIFQKLDACDIRDCLILHVGDVGIGFVNYSRQMAQIHHLNDRFKERNIIFWAVRGNHEKANPYFNGSIKLSNFELLPDYTHREINGKTFLFVGGAVSVDRKWRKEGVDWWPDEVFVLCPEKIKKCDILISHTVPSWIGPQTLGTWGVADPTLIPDCHKERADMDKLIELCECKYSYHGHMHERSFAEKDGCKASILDVCEFRELEIEE